jgi:protein-arginine kinase activator protein McsA
MQSKPYYCPNCRSNRTKFKLISSYSQQFMKDAVTGEVQDLQEPMKMDEMEATVACLVCGFTSNEMRFVKQAERDPRTASISQATYS